MEYKEIKKYVEHICGMAKMPCYVGQGDYVTKNPDFVKWPGTEGITVELGVLEDTVCGYTLGHAPSARLIQLCTFIGHKISMPVQYIDDADGIRDDRLDDCPQRAYIVSPFANGEDGFQIE